MFMENVWYKFQNTEKNFYENASSNLSWHNIETHTFLPEPLRILGFAEIR